MNWVSNADDAKKRLRALLMQVQGVSIKSVFSFCLPRIREEEVRKYIYECTKFIYVLFQNHMCLVIQYQCIDELFFELRPLTDEEQGLFDREQPHDCFNYSSILDLNIQSALAYSDIVDVILDPVSQEYTKWMNDGVEVVSPTEETFDKIHFLMSNGKTFTICPDDAEVCDTWLWSKDAIET